jgi:hypothetical protein
MVHAIDIITMNNVKYFSGIFLPPTKIARASRTNTTAA